MWGVETTIDVGDSTAESTSSGSTSRDCVHADSGVSGEMTSTKRAMTRCLVAQSCAEARLGNGPNHIGWESLMASQIVPISTPSRYQGTKQKPHRWGGVSVSGWIGGQSTVIRWS